MTTSAIPLTQGAHHVGLTVPNVAETAAFFTDVLGFTKVGEKPGYPAIFVSDGAVMITIWQVDQPETAKPFCRKTVVGLHHLALKVADHAALDRLNEALRATQGVEIEFATEDLGPGPMRHMMCAIPGGVRVEFIAPPA